METTLVKAILDCIITFDPKTADTNYVFARAIYCKEKKNRDHTGGDVVSVTFADRIKI